MIPTSSRLGEMRLPKNLTLTHNSRQRVSGGSYTHSLNFGVQNKLKVGVGAVSTTFHKVQSGDDLSSNVTGAIGVA